MTARVIGRTGKASGVDRPVQEMLRVGSSPDNDLTVESRTVSRQHVQIVQSGDSYVVEDLDSRNGTFLNGQRVKRFPIRHLDVLTLGSDIDLIFLETGAAPVLPVRRQGPLHAAVVWIDGPWAGRTQEIPPDEGLMLGRRLELEPMAAISRRHAILTVRGDRVTIEDLGSANGTQVNGTPISVVTPLREGDEVSLAGLVRCRVSMSGEAPMAVAASAPGETPETVAVDRPAAASARTLNVPASATGAKPPERKAPDRPAAPTPAAPAPAPAVAAPSPSAPAAPAPPPAVAAPDPDVNSPTVTAPREAAISPPSLSAAQRAAPPAFGDGTIAAPREPASVPAFSASRGAPPFATVASFDEPSSTFALPRDAAGGVPASVVARAIAARDALGATMVAPDMGPPGAVTKPAPPPAPAAAAPAAPATGTGPVLGLRLEGPETVTLNRGTFVVGRHADADVRLDVRDVGRRHARLTIDEAGASVEDLDTANGTFINDQQTTGRQPVPDGSRLRFATVEFVVVYLRSEGTST